MVHVTAEIPLASNFLVPNGTFFVELIAFGIIVWILAKCVIPPINRAMRRARMRSASEFAELDEAKAKAEKAENEYREQLVEARHEAAKIREQAREEGALIIAEMREKAQAEAERIVQLAHQQVRGRAPAGRGAAARRGRHDGDRPGRSDRR